MRFISNPIIIGLDHGYANIKTAHFVFPAGVVEYTHAPYSLANVLEYRDKYHVIGSGRQFLQRDKTMTDSYYHMTLAAIAKELEYRNASPDSAVILAAGLPLTEYGRDREKFAQYLLRDNEPVDFRYAGNAYHITIQAVKLFPQGYAAVLTQPELLEEPSVIVADIGGWTVDLMQLDNRMPNAATCRSLEYGMLRCLDEIAEQIRRTMGVSMSDTQIEAVLRSEATGVNDKAREIIHAIAEQYVLQLLSAIRQSGLDYGAMPTVFLGGGASLLKRHVPQRVALCRPFILDDVSLNAKGYERLCAGMSGESGNG